MKRYVALFLTVVMVFFLPFRASAAYAVEIPVTASQTSVVMDISTGQVLVEKEMNQKMCLTPLQSFTSCSGAFCYFSSKASFCAANVFSISSFIKQIQKDTKSSHRCRSRKRLLQNPLQQPLHIGTCSNLACNLRKIVDRRLPKLQELLILRLAF